MKTFEINTSKMFTDITDEIARHVPDGFNGFVVVYCGHTTASLVMLENELLHLVDVRFFLDTLAPRFKEPEGSQGNTKYLHDLVSLRNDTPPDERINGHSHVRSLLFNSSEVIPILDGALILNSWKRLFFVELDPARDRVIHFGFIQETVV